MDQWITLRKIFQPRLLSSATSSRLLTNKACQWCSVTLLPAECDLPWAELPLSGSQAETSGWELLPCVLPAPHWPRSAGPGGLCMLGHQEQSPLELVSLWGPSAAHSTRSSVFYSQIQALDAVRNKDSPVTQQHCNMSVTHRYKTMDRNGKNYLQLQEIYQSPLYPWPLDYDQ